MLLDRLDDINKLDLGSECVAMVDQWLVIRSVPTVQLDATTTHAECTGIRFGGTFAGELVPGEIRVVTGSDPVVGHGMGHVLVHLVAISIPQFVWFGKQEIDKLEMVIEG